MGKTSLKPKPTILLLADAMSAGGTERQIIELIKGLKSRNNFKIAFGILEPGGEREKEVAGIVDLFIPVNQKCRFDFTPAFSLLWISKKHEIQLFHTFGSLSDLAGLFASKLLGLPIINGSIRSARSALNLRDRLSKKCMRFSNWVVANSSAGLRTFGLEGCSRAGVIYNGIDLSRFDGVKPVDNNSSIICMVGNFTKKKDQAPLIRALPGILEEFPQTKLLLIGRGEERLAECRQLALSLDLMSNVEFISNTNHPEPFIAASQIGVLITNTLVHGEGISNSILEYMALSKPVVASDSGGNIEVVEHNKTGYLIDENTPEDIAGEILKLLRDPERALQMGKLGRERVENKFNLDRMIDEYESLYYQLLFAE